MAITIKFENYIVNGEVQTVYNPQEPTFVLMSRSGRRLGLIPASNIVVKCALNAADELSFSVHKSVETDHVDYNSYSVDDGLDLYDFDLNDSDTLGGVFWNQRITNPVAWDDITDLKLLWCVEWNKVFQIAVEVDEGEGLTKYVTATSLGESETSQAYLYEIEINTEADILRDDYVVTILYDENDPNGSLLDRITEKLPHYSITHVDGSIAGIQRTFTFDNISIYDAFQEIAQEINCLFNINCYIGVDGKLHREISVYDLETYGQDTTIFVSTENLTDEVRYSTDVGSVKNCFRLEAGDDLMTASVRNCNPNGSGYIWYIPDEVRQDMSSALAAKLAEYDTLYDYYQNSYEIDVETEASVYNDLIDQYSVYTTDYNKIQSPIVGYPALMQAYYNALDFYYYLHDVLMPDPGGTSTTAAIEVAKLNAATLSPTAVQDLTYVSANTAESAILGYARVFVDSRYRVSIETVSFNNNNWVGKFTCTNYYDETDTATSPSNIIIALSSSYGVYVNQRIQKSLQRKTSDDAVGIIDLFSLTLSDFAAALKEYSYVGLSTLRDACQLCLDVMIEQGISNRATWAGTVEDLYTQMYLDYYQKLNAIDQEIIVRGNELAKVGGRRDSDGTLNYTGILNVLDAYKDTIQSTLNFEDYLGEDLWLEFAAYRREDTYQNSNYISDGLSTAELFDRSLEFINVAKEEIYKSALLQHSISSTLANLLVIKEFQPIVDHFELGNWLRIKIDDNIYRLRLIEYEIDFDNLENLTVTFSDVVNVVNGISDAASIIKQAVSMSTSYGAVSRQAKQGASGNTKLNNWVDNGLALTKMKIIDDADYQDIVWDDHGILAREYLPITDEYDDRQLKIINKGLYVTDDNWLTSKAGIGEFVFYNPMTQQYEDAYGVIADTLVGNLILGETVGVYNTSGSVAITEDGIEIIADGTTGANTASITIKRKTVDQSGQTWLTNVFYVDSNGILQIGGGESVLVDGHPISTTDVTVSRVDVEYSSNQDPETAPTTGWSTDPPVWADGYYIWSRTRTVYLDPDVADDVSDPVCITGAKGESGTAGANTAIVYLFKRASSAQTVDWTQSLTYTFSTHTLSSVPTGWSQSIPSGSDPLYVTAATAYGSGATDSISYNEWSTPVIMAQDGKDGDGATVYSILSSNSAIIKNEYGDLSPTGITFTAQSMTGSGVVAAYLGRFIISTTTNNTTWTTAYTSSSDQSSYTFTIPSDVIGIRCSLYKAGGTTTLLDQQTVPIVSEGGSAYTITLTNESHTFVGGTSSAVGATTRCDVIVYKGSVRQAATIGTISGAPTGLTFKIYNNGTTTAYFTATATSSLSTLEGSVTIPITVGGILFNKTFSYAVALKGATGDAGAKTAIVYLYTRAASAPSSPSGNITYTFSDGSMSGSLGVWSQDIPSGTNPIYITAATAYGTATTYTITSSQWSTPVILAQNGSDTGLHSATVFLYQRATSQPATPTGNLVYTFSTGTMSGSYSPWELTIPGTNGSPCWVTQATAISTTDDTDTITPSEWVTARKLVEDGASAAAGLNSATVFLYKRASTTPTKPTNALTYTFASGNLSGSLSGWSQTIPASDGNPCYVIQATAVSADSSITINASSWSEVSMLTNDGVGVQSIISQFYKSTSKEEPTGGVWVNTYADTGGWEEGAFLWTRSLITYTDGTEVTTQPYCDSSWEAIDNLEIGGVNILRALYVYSYNDTDETAVGVVPTFNRISQNNYYNAMTGTYTLVVDSVGEWNDYILHDGDVLTLNDGNTLGYPVSSTTAMIYSQTNAVALPVGVAGSSCIYHANSISQSDDYLNPVARIRFANAQGAVIANQTYDLTPTELVKYITVPTNAAYVQLQLIVDTAKGDNIGDTVVFEGIKLEIGNKATAWSPSPADVIAKIAEAESEIYKSNEQIELRVTYGDVVNAVNVSTEGVAISGNKISLKSYGYDASAWATSKSYVAGDYCKYNGTTYMCIKNHTSSSSNRPGSSASSTYWTTSSGSAVEINEYFKIDSNGKMYAQKGGNLAGWEIGEGSTAGDGYLYYDPNTTKAMGSSNSIYLWPKGHSASLTFGGTSYTKDWVITAGNRFAVAKDGTLYANSAVLTSATVSGTITTSNLTATAGTIGGLTIASASSTSSFSGLYSNYIQVTPSHLWAGYGSNTYFQANSSGAQITGAIYARSGTFGSGTNVINIGTGTLSDGTAYSAIYGLSHSSLDSTSSSFYLGTDGFSIGNGSFNVTSNGVLTASGATISGNFTMTGGSINIRTDSTGSNVIVLRTETTITDTLYMNPQLLRLQEYNGTSTWNTDITAISISTPRLYITSDTSRGTSAPSGVAGNGELYFVYES